MTVQRSNHRAANNSPSRTCNSRTRNRSTCSAATPTAASKRGNTTMDLQYERRDSDCPAKAQRIVLQPLRARTEPEQAPVSRRVPRLDGYSTVEGNRGKGIVSRLLALEGEARGRLEHGNLAQANELNCNACRAGRIFLIEAC